MATVAQVIRRLTDGFRRYFFRGLAAFLPIAVTLWILDLMIRFMDRGTTFLPPQLRPEKHLPFEFPGVGAVITIVLLWFVGFIVTHLVSAKAEQTWNRVLNRIPVVRGIYSAVRQLVEAIFSEKSRRFRNVVLIEYPRKGIWSLALVTAETEGEVADHSREKLLNLFIPTTPNPTSGWYIIIPEKDAIHLDMTVEEAFKVIISGGIVVPPSRKGTTTDADRQEPHRAAG